VIPAAFLADDQLRRGLLPGDKAIWIVLFGAPLAVLVTLGDNAHGTTFGGTPASLLAALALFAAILRRTFSDGFRSAQPVLGTSLLRPLLPAQSCSREQDRE
jgi:acetylornithine/succinyldiaminopimelate/putrescine aminotransferase